MIGREWAGRLPNGGRRIDDPDDLLREEIAAALQLGVRTIPVLVQDGRLPPAGELPEPLRPLAQRHALRIDDTGVKHQIADLIAVIEQTVKRRPPSSSTDPLPEPDPPESDPPESDPPESDPPEPDSPVLDSPVLDPPPLLQPPLLQPPSLQPPPVEGSPPVSGAWWLLPVLLPLLGGIIAYARVRTRNASWARWMLIVGIVQTVLVAAIVTPLAL
jgi:hypothetical protein